MNISLGKSTINTCISLVPKSRTEDWKARSGSAVEPHRAASVPVRLSELIPRQASDCLSALRAQLEGVLRGSDPRHAALSGQDPGFPVRRAAAVYPVTSPGQVRV